MSHIWGTRLRDVAWISGKSGKSWGFPGSHAGSPVVTMVVSMDQGFG